ncbi:MAG: hypothetical protein IPK17_05150 [Chloroflexi bacterium]|uniref:carbohydrate binding domain-containing protein n=1 Tax=Candidatus Flexifilum breve TaxID=3140694 RepID=UPI003137281B|nr:hypothetical protein [Chloroflexota bacterium]
MGSWGGVTHAFTDGATGRAWIGRPYSALTFWLFGSASGAQIQIDLFDNRSATQPGDTAERYFYRIPDDFSGWRQFVIPFELFQRRTDPARRR